MHNVVEGLWPLLVPIASVRLDPQNARLHPPKNLAQIKLSLQTYGQRKPIVVRDENAVAEAGNGLLQAAIELGWSEIAAVRVQDKESVAKAYAIMDNKSAMSSDWDLPILKDILAELDCGDLSMDITGFDTEEIERMMTAVWQPEKGLPEGEGELSRRVIITFVSEEEELQFWSRLGRENAPAGRVLFKWSELQDA